MFYMTVMPDSTMIRTLLRDETVGSLRSYMTAFDDVHPLNQW